MDELQRKGTGNFGGDGTAVCSLGLGFDVFQVFFTVFPYLITNAVSVPLIISGTPLAFFFLSCVQGQP